MQRKHLYALLYLFVIFIILFYSFVYFTNKDSTIDINYSIISEISDYNEIDQHYREAVKESINYFTLDSMKKFNAKKPLIRIDAIKLFDKIGRENIKSYGNTTSELPYFNDFNSNDAHTNSIKSLTSHISKKKDFPSYNDILGYEIKKSEPMTRLEFVLLLSSFLEPKNVGHTYKDVPDKFKKQVATVNAYGIIQTSDNLMANDPVTREQAALMIHRFNQSVGK
ncbi:S-layer homology domain-containing protein [Alkaliphilus sp. B6464]|uniref:S-layer homology domain-containing protein n=1 Tax=Alkaliphilus sp. B6464 TaxID=2731219 RepID=UPI001BA9DEBA|nr:S-layer homology domain-containing protein [Alkaliphilus sp. B6464]QUH22116.1 S-layer homology domain-containing protein [Alkaliphilus sp. B6464]